MVVSQKRRLPGAIRRRQLAEAAIRLIAKSGPDGYTLAELGAEVGITDASVLRHFPNKQAISAAACELFANRLLEDIPTDVEDPLASLGAFFVRRVKRVRAQPELMSLAYDRRLQDAAGPSGSPEAKKVQAIVSKSAAFLSAAIEEAQAKHLISRAVPTAVWVWILVGVIRGGGAPTPTGVARVSDIHSMSPERLWELLLPVLGGTSETKNPILLP